MLNSKHISCVTMICMYDSVFFYKIITLFNRVDKQDIKQSRALRSLNLQANSKILLRNGVKENNVRYCNSIR